MKRITTALACAALVALLASPAGAAPDRTIVAPRGATTTWAGAARTAVAPTFFTDGLGTPLPAFACSKDATSYCEATLVEVPVYTDADAAALRATVSKGVSITIGNYAPFPASDFDLIVYESDATGAKGAEVARVGDLDTDPSETATLTAKGTNAKRSTFFLVEVVYFASPQSGYAGSVTVAK